MLGVGRSQLLPFAFASARSERKLLVEGGSCTEASYSRPAVVLGLAVLRGSRRVFRARADFPDRLFPERPETRAKLFGKEFGLFPGGEVTTLCNLVVSGSGWDRRAPPRPARSGRARPGRRSRPLAP